MGFDCSYQGVPEHADLIRRAYGDPGFAESVFYPVIAYAKRLEEEHYFQDREFASARELFKQYPGIRTWNYKPVSRMHDALVYMLNPESYSNSNGYMELEQTLSYRFVKGEKVFSEHLRTTQGVQVRVSSANFVRECLDVFSNFRLEELEGNFDAEKMTNLGIYKTGQTCEYRRIENYFSGLIDYYRKMTSLENMAIFICED